MPSYSMPALNVPYTRDWSEQDVNKFHRLPYWTSVLQDEMTKDTLVHAKFYGDVKWQPNKGKFLRTIIPQHTPINRQFLRPKLLDTFPRVDTVNPGQRELVDQVFEHMFMSDLLFWSPQFYDLFQTIELYTKDIARKVALFPEWVCRTSAYHQARFMMFSGMNADPTTPSLEILGRDVILAQQGTGEETDSDTNPVTGKTLAWLKPFVLQMTGESGLTLANAHRAITFMAQQNMKPFKGGNKIGTDNKIPEDMYCLVVGTEANAQWIFDKLVRNLAGTQANMLNGDYVRPLLNRLCVRTEDRPIRYYQDPVTKDLSIPEPETVVFTGENAGEVIPNPQYTNAQYEVAFLYSGETPGNAIKPGPPPSAFSNNGPSGNFAKLSWNGEIITYVPNLIQVPAAGGGLTWCENRDKRYLQLQSNVAGGVQCLQKRAVLPIMFKRNIGVSSPN